MTRHLRENVSRVRRGAGVQPLLTQRDQDSGLVGVSVKGAGHV